MIKIAINKEISRWYGIREADISEQLKAASPGEEIEISINSPGGEVYEGIAIFNLIRDYAKSHNIIVKINGLVASMASYIAIAARTINKDAKIFVSENSIFLIHNPWNVTMGDYRALQKAAEYLEKLAAMSASTYAYVSGKDEKETRDLMDIETYFVGNEIIENGFANEFEKINKEENESLELDRNTLIINARLQCEKTMEKLRATVNTDLEKAVALINKTLPPKASGGLSLEHTPSSGVTAIGGDVLLNTSKGEIMDKNELKQKHPELYASIFNEGKEEGKEEGKKEERERVESHLGLGEETGSMELATKFIKDGNSVMENKVQAEYLSARMKNSALNSRNDDNPPPNSPANGNGADDAAMDAAWKQGLSGKDLKGDK